MQPAILNKKVVVGGDVENALDNIFTKVSLSHHLAINFQLIKFVKSYYPIGI